MDPKAQTPATAEAPTAMQQRIKSLAEQQIPIDLNTVITSPALAKIIANGLLTKLEQQVEGLERLAKLYIERRPAFRTHLTPEDTADVIARFQTMIDRLESLGESIEGTD